MKRLFPAVAASIALAGGILILTGQEPKTQDVQFTSDNQLVKPKNFREWIYLSSGLGMTYGPAADLSREPMFDNVFVNPSSYRSFMQNGKWPDKTIFILEIRSSVGKGSINNAGHYQSGVMAVEAAVKDESRFPGNWGYFGFGRNGETAKAFPATAACYTCHPTNGAVDNTFVQFYPTLLEVAKAKGTLKPSNQP
jgi:hypothetical protein